MSDAKPQHDEPVEDATPRFYQSVPVEREGDTLTVPSLTFESVGTVEDPEFPSFIDG